MILTRVLVIFEPATIIKKFENSISNQLDQGLRLLYELSYSDENKFWSIFTIGELLTKKNSKTAILTKYDNSYTY
jgi:hypothetical protein